MPLVEQVQGTAEEVKQPVELSAEEASRSGVRYAGLLVLVSGSYFLAGKFGLQFASLHPSVTVLWAPTGISIAALLLGGYRMWPAILAGAFLVNVSTSGAMVNSLEIATGDLLEGLTGAYLVKKYADGAKAFLRPEFVIRYTLFAGLLATGISATVGVSALCQDGLVRSGEFGSVWLTRWLGDMLGALVLAPFLIILLGNRHNSLQPGETLELGGLLAALSLVSVVVFGPVGRTVAHGHGREFMCFPFLVWAAFRFCPLETAGANLVFFGFATWGTLHGYGPYASGTEPPIVLGSLVAIVGTTSLIVAAAVREARSDKEELLSIHGLLRSILDKKTQDLDQALGTLNEETAKRAAAGRSLAETRQLLGKLAETIPDVFWLFDAIEQKVLYVNPAFEAIWGRSPQILFQDSKAWLSAVHPEDKEKAKKLLELRAAWPEEGKCEVQYRIRRPDGEERWIQAQAFVIRDEQGRVCRVAGLASDITQPKGEEAESQRGAEKGRGLDRRPNR
jgi:PAS domain S-box-containing protein